MAEKTSFYLVINFIKDKGWGGGLLSTKKIRKPPLSPIESKGAKCRFFHSNIGGNIILSSNYPSMYTLCIALGISFLHKLNNDFHFWIQH